jgi:GTP-binding protein HflX
MTQARLRAKQRVLLVGLERAGGEWEASLEELARLADTAGVEVVGTVSQRLRQPDPIYFVGKGKAHEIKQAAGELGAEVVLVDGDLKPVQQRNLETAAGTGVLDRTALILDIFAQRARSREGKLQVELAQLSYLLPRLAGKGTELSRLGGGIGTRGPGETKLEVDRRRIRKRIGLLRKQVERIGKRRGLERRHRQEAGLPLAALVGYTNAGKSTLLNALSGSEVFVEDRLFATLDATIRRVALAGGREVLVADTVGFIRNLPHQLVAAFHATLEEVIEAEVLVHVADASHPQMEEQMAAAERVLADLGCASKPTVVALNKADLVENRERLLERAARERHVVVISALTGEGLGELLRLVGERLDQELVAVEVVVPWAVQELVAEAHARGRVLAEESVDEGISLQARVPEDLAGRLRRSARVAETAEAS